MPNDDSYDLVLDLLRERITAQFDQLNTLDSKANVIMTAATTLLGAALVLLAALLVIPNHLITLNYAYFQIGMTGLLSIYLLTMLIAAISGYWIRNLRRVPEPDSIIGYATKPKADTQSAVVGTMGMAFNKNKRVIFWKVLGMRIAVIGFCLEIITLVILIFVQLYS